MLSVHTRRTVQHQSRTSESKRFVDQYVDSLVEVVCEPQHPTILSRKKNHFVDGASNRSGLSVIKQVA
ncbi:uncharacterized [Tachysurus ichikawai]